MASLRSHKLEPDYYADLGLTRNATTQEIRRAFRVQALKHHPDKKSPGQSSDATEFRRAREAYEFLIDNNNRAAYDRQYMFARTRYHPRHKFSQAPQQHERQRWAAQRKREADAAAAKVERLRRRALREEARRERRRQRLVREKARRSEAVLARQRREQEELAKIRLQQEQIQERFKYEFNSQAPPTAEEAARARPATLERHTEQDHQAAHARPYGNNYSNVQEGYYRAGPRVSSESYYAPWQYGNGTQRPAHKSYMRNAGTDSDLGSLPTRGAPMRAADARHVLDCWEKTQGTTICVGCWTFRDDEHYKKTGHHVHACAECLEKFRQTGKF